MKKFFKVTSTIIVILAIVVLLNKLEILSFDLKISPEKIASYSEYYYNQLELDEKEMYVAIDEAVKARKTGVFLGTQNRDGLNEKVNKVITAYFYDNPEYYYISNEYTVYTRDFKIFTYCKLELNYIMDIAKLDETNQIFEDFIRNFLKLYVNDTMTDFEKEVAIHDGLAKDVEYYDYIDIKSIPIIKHTAYGALVERNAVCDGYAKAYKLLLDRVNIDSVIINGVTDNIAHAWNAVKLDDEYYYVDVTADKLQDASGEYAVHTYFNITYDQLVKTHIFGDMFEYPKAIATKYDYYIQNDYYVGDDGNLYNELNDIMSSQQNSRILEIKVDSKYSVRRIIDVLYELNFDDWRYRGENKVPYHNIEDIYIFIKH